MQSKSKQDSSFKVWNSIEQYEFSTNMEIEYGNLIDNCAQFYVILLLQTYMYTYRWQTDQILW